MGCGSSTAVEQASPGVAVPMPVPAVLTLEPLKSSSTRRARKGSVEAELDSMGDDVSLVLDVEGFLESLTLEQYWPAFSSAGYAELSTLSDVTEADLQALEIKAGHIKKLLKNLEKLQSKMLHSPGPAHLVQMTPDLDNQSLVSPKGTAQRIPVPLVLSATTEEEIVTGANDAPTPPSASFRSRRQSADAELEAIAHESETETLDLLRTPASQSSVGSAQAGPPEIEPLVLKHSNTSSIDGSTGRSSLRAASFNEEEENLDGVSSPTHSQSLLSRADATQVEGRERIVSKRSCFTARSSYSTLPEVPDGDLEALLRGVDGTPESTPSNTPHAGDAAAASALGSSPSPTAAAAVTGSGQAAAAVAEEEHGTDGSEGDEVRPTQEPESSSSGDNGGQEEKGDGDEQTTEERDAAAGIGGVDAAAVETPG